MKERDSGYDENVTFHLLKRIPSKNDFINSLLRPLNLALAVIGTRREARKIRPDVFNAHFVAEYGLIGALAGCRPLIESVWGSDILVYPKKSAIWKRLVSYALKKADAITTTAAFMGEYISTNFGIPQEKISRIPWGIDLKIFRGGYEEEVSEILKGNGIPPGSAIVLSIRTMAPIYNIDKILDSVPLVIERFPDAVFVFIGGCGTPEYEKEMLLKAEGLGISKNIRMVSKLLQPNEMAAYLNSAMAFVSIPRTDQFACGIMEGMACGAVPILSSIEVYRQYLEDGKNALFADPDDPKNLADRIIYCLEHPEIKKEFHDINIKIIEENENWDANSKLMEKLYAKISSGRSG